MWNPYRLLVSRHGKYYVYPWGEEVQNSDPQRRCFTRRGAYRKAAKLNRREEERFPVATSDHYIFHLDKKRWQIGYFEAFPPLQ